MNGSDPAPGAIVMPRTTEDVQKIVKIRLFAFRAVLHRFLRPSVPSHMDDELIIDMKRMRDFEIDGKHFFITVQPGGHLLSDSAGML